MPESWMRAVRLRGVRLKLIPSFLVVGVSLLIIAACGDSEPPRDATVLPIPTPSATPRAVFPSPTAEPRCKPAGASQVGRSPFCVTWRDQYEDELGFVIVLEYGHGPGDEVFRYEVAPNEREFLFPEADSPGDTLETCLGRSGMQVFVSVLLPNSVSEEIVAFAADYECRGYDQSTEDYSDAGPNTAESVPPPAWNFWINHGEFWAYEWDDRTLSAEEKERDPVLYGGWPPFAECMADRGHQVVANEEAGFRQPDLDALIDRLNEEYPDSSENESISTAADTSASPLTSSLARMTG